MAVAAVRRPGSLLKPKAVVTAVGIAVCVSAAALALSHSPNVPGRISSHQIHNIPSSRASAASLAAQQRTTPSGGAAEGPRDAEMRRRILLLLYLSAHGRSDLGLLR